MPGYRSIIGALLASVIVALAAAAQPIQVGFLWHMHQPIYYPYVSLTASEPYFTFSPVDVHNQRLGPYTTWPNDAVTAGLSLPHLGAQVSFSGSLIENLNALEQAGLGGGSWQGWSDTYVASQGSLTALGNRRLDLVAFGYHHPLMPLLDERDIRMQIALHKHVYGQTWHSPYARGMFPPETAFSTRMIPALVAEGIEWVLVDNIHFDRAAAGYPYTAATGLVPPNAADQVNPDPVDEGGAWVQLNNLWAPSRVSVPFGYQPHYAQHVDPHTGEITRIVVVPAARYEGNEDGRGGYGAFLYDEVMDAYLPFNTDPAHPMFVVLHHDGDNFGGGSEAYYHGNFQQMVAWAGADPDYDVTTVDDYLARFPPDSNDVIHVEDGAWAGADNGDPQFSKWLGAPDADGVSPDRHSWAVLTAAKNRVFTAEAIAPAVDMQNVLEGAGTPTERAWHYLLVSQASDYWYWDGSPEPWDGNVTRGANLAVAEIEDLVDAGPDTVGPTIFAPQRDPYNPGALEWGPGPETSNFEVWTLAYDLNGLAAVTLRYRTDLDGHNPLTSSANEVFADSAEVGAWQSLPMVASDVPAPPGVPVPAYRALRYAAEIAGFTDTLVDYYVEAIDGLGNVSRSAISHVYVGNPAGSGSGSRVRVSPEQPQAGSQVAISYDPAGGPLQGAPNVLLHHGFDGWSTVIAPDAAMSFDVPSQRYVASVPIPASATALDVVFNDGAGAWDNNEGLDWHFPVSGAVPSAWVMDGEVDTGALLVARSGGTNLWAGLAGDALYVATDAAGIGRDVFVLVAAEAGPMQPAMWAKAGLVARWDAFLADENDNGFAGWFDTTGSTDVASGAVVEGILDLSAEFGSRPSSLALAVARYDTPDGGALDPASQVGESINDDGNVDAAEFVGVTVQVLGGDEACDTTGNKDASAVCLSLQLPRQQPVRPGPPIAGPAVRGSQRP